MLCPKCKSNQADTAKFCSECAQPLTAQSKPAASSTRWPLFVLLAFVLVVLALVVQRNLIRAERQQAAIRHAMGVPPQATPALFPTSHVLQITNGAAAVKAGALSWYTFVVPAGATTVAVNGHFSATGGSGNDIECYIVDDDGLTNLKNGHQARAYFNSGKVTEAKIGAVLAMPGTYYLVLDNRFSLLTPKAVQIDAVVSYMQ
jgi:hypothetical protein